MSESVEDIIRRIVRQELERVFGTPGSGAELISDVRQRMHDAAAGRTVPAPEVCAWNPITARPDCGFDLKCSVHGVKPPPVPKDFYCDECNHPQDQHSKTVGCLVESGSPFCSCTQPGPVA